MSRKHGGLSLKMSVKRFLVDHPKLYKTLYYAYRMLVDFQGREHRLNKRGKGSAYYVIRPRTNCIEGLLALYVFVMKKVDYALRMGYTPVIDMKNYKTQYSNGKDNVWEWFFRQPGGTSLEEAYQSSRPVICSGYKWKREEDETLFSQQVFEDETLNLRCHDLMFDSMGFSEEIETRVQQELQAIPVDRCIGVYLRGTDYVKLKPVGENVQPTAEMMIEKIKEFREKHGNPSIFLVTEDNEIYQKIKEAFPDDIYLVSYDSFITDYDGKDFLSKSNVFKTDMRTVGENYLVKMILLSKCRYLVSSITCGSRVAYVFNGNKYADKYIFDLGLYE